MPVLDPSSGYYTIINTFVVEPENAQTLLTSLSKATEDIFLRMPGFVSASFHMGENRRHVANYGQWRSKKDYEDARDDPAVQSHMRSAAKLAISFEPVFYDLVEAHTAVQESLS